MDLAFPNSTTRRGRVQDGGKTCPTLTCNSELGVVIIDDQGRRNKKHQPKEICPTLRAQTHGNEPKVVVDALYKNREPREYTDAAPTLRSERQGLMVKNNFRIRKLTPKECFRLQGWPDEYFHKAELVNSNSQLYKQAGNGVTVTVIYEIARRF